MFLLGYVFGLVTAATWLIGQAFYEATQMKKRRGIEGSID